MIGETELAAYHEASHALVAHHFGRQIRAVKLYAEGGGMLYCEGLPHDVRDKFQSLQRWRQLAKEEICICLGGPLGEQRISGSDDPESWEVDLMTVQRWEQELGPDARVRELTDITRELLADERTWAAVSKVAERLSESGSVSGPDVETICRALKVPQQMIDSGA